MSVVVENLTKRYGTQTVVDEISFEAPKGKITGFLGPNGAGKSTTMKIAAGYNAPTSGTILLCGNDVTEGGISVKRLTGYLPEHNPLYLDMYVKEYLGFVGDAYRLPNKKRSIQEIIATCGLELEQHKKIRALSKGYRQRVGLAQALIHDPEVLILDEPTSGLDPNQLVEIRKVIKDASKNKTVILSTHIMQEVEALCDNVVIINRGNIVADNTVRELQETQDQGFTYRVTFETVIDESLFEVFSIKRAEEAVYLISDKTDIRKEIMKIVSDKSLPLLSIAREKQSLEGIFRTLTAEN